MRSPPLAEKNAVRHRYSDPRRIVEIYVVDFFLLPKIRVRKKKLKINKAIIAITKKELNGPLLI